MPEPTEDCQPWCDNHVGASCAAAFELYLKPTALRGRESLRGIEGIGGSCNDLELSVGSDLRYDEDAAPTLWCSLNLSKVDDIYRGEARAVLQTNGPGMKSIHAQLGRFLAFVRSGDAHRAEHQPGISPAKVVWTARNPAEQHLDDCQPWCRDHGEEGCGLKMTLALTGRSSDENLVYGNPVPAGGAADLLAARAICTPGAEGSQGCLYLGLDCWNTVSDDVDEYRTDRTASLPVTLSALKRIHTKLGKLLVKVEA